MARDTGINTTVSVSTDREVITVAIGDRGENGKTIGTITNANISGIDITVKAAVFILSSKLKTAGLSSQ